MNVKIWTAPLDFGSDFEIRCPWQVGMDASLHAHLGGTGFPGLGGTVPDLLQRQGVRVGIGPALRRAFASGVPYLVNVVTDPEAVYPRSTTGV